MHLDKAPDAFRTISEVADDLDIPQHVLRFWETRFTQIKPMKRSGGRRYYRPDDVDLLRGIRRLLYGEGYTIRGVQRILKENGVKSVQGIAAGSAPAVFATAGAVAGRGDAADDHDAMTASAVAHDDDETGDVPATFPVMAPMIATPVIAPVMVRRAPATASLSPVIEGPATAAPAPVKTHQASPVSFRAEPRRDTARLEAALKDLMACRQMLDDAVKDG